MEQRRCGLLGVSYLGHKSSDPTYFPYLITHHSWKILRKKKKTPNITLQELHKAWHQLTLPTHNHISWQSASSQCGTRGCHPEMRDHRQTLLADSRPAGVCLWEEASCCERGCKEFCHSWSQTSCRVPNSTWISFPHWSGSPDRGQTRWGGFVWACSPVLFHCF